MTLLLGLACGNQSDELASDAGPRDATGMDRAPADGMVGRGEAGATDAASFDGSGSDGSQADDGATGDGGLPPRPPNEQCVAPARHDLWPTLSASGCFDPVDPARPAAALIAYDVNAPLWSDGADKDRWLLVPDDEHITVESDGDLSFPLGSMLFKTFRFGDHLLETRVFILHDDGVWDGYAYAWSAAQTDAALVPAGFSDPFEVPGTDPPVTWRIPSRLECLRCHTEAAGTTLGLEVGQLNRTVADPTAGDETNQLVDWEAMELFDAPLGAPVDELSRFARYDETASAEAPARAYLHANCSMCHRPEAPGGGALDLRATVELAAMNVCGVDPTRDDLGIANAQLVRPGAPDRSVVLERMLRLDEHRMPPIATRVVDPTGTRLVQDWIERLESCP